VPPEDGDFNVEAAVTSFLADEGGGGDDSSSDDVAEPAATGDAEEAAAGATDDESGEDGEQTETDTDSEEAAEGTESGEAEKVAAKDEREPTELEKAIKARDVKAFIAALGDAAEELMGGKAHKVLRLAAKEVREGEEKLAKSAKALTERFADPTAAFEAAKKGPEGADAFVDAIERQAGGASWADIVKYVNDSQAGKEARLQAKAKAETEKTAAADAKRAEHEKTLRTLITDTVKASDAKLLEPNAEAPDLADAVVSDVFAVMKAGWSKGINTPAKALAQVKKRYLAIAKLLAPAAPAAAKTPPTRRAPPALRQPRIPQSKGEPPKDVDDMVDQFLREEGYHGR
jgi:hypothetical protein